VSILHRLFKNTADSGTVVSGVVHPFGAAGSRSQGEKDWTLSFSLQPWRVPGGALEESELRVRRTVREDELDSLRDQISPCAVLRARVQLDRTSLLAELLELLGEDAAAADLHARAAALQQPVTQTDPLFGTLTFDRSLDWWDGSGLWEGRPVQLHFDAELTAALETARALWSEQPTWDHRVRDYAVQKLLPLKNEEWLGEDEAELSPEAFVSRMALESITFYDEGEFSFMYDDGDLFWGHAIQISGNLAEGPNDADIPG
jgi:hypothetical protein